MLRLRVKGYSAPEAVGNCARNAAAHAQVLRRYDIGNITSAKQGWWQNTLTYALLLDDAQRGAPLGAVRLQRWGNGVPLPLENALANVDPRVHGWLRELASNGVGELCGLWCSPRLKGFGMGAVLTRMGLSLSTQVRTNTVLGLCDTRNVESNLRLGFRRDASLAAHGSFEYPKPGLYAHVLRVVDAQRLQHATNDNRMAVHEYRDAPVGEELIEGNDGRLVLERDLRIAPAARGSLHSVRVPRGVLALLPPRFPWARSA